MRELFLLMSFQGTIMPKSQKKAWFYYEITSDRKRNSKGHREWSGLNNLDSYSSKLIKKTNKIHIIIFK
jgi:hypothetical protein